MSEAKYERKFAIMASIAFIIIGIIIFSALVWVRLPKRILISLAIAVFWVPVAYAALVVYVLMPPLRSFPRMHEKLPSVSVEPGNIFYCRMLYCDFRFPLPRAGRIIRVDPVIGGADGIDGEVYLVGPKGGPVDMRAYAELLQTKQFDATPADGSGCPCITNRLVDVPFVSDGKVIHYPQFDDFWASSSNELGGSIEVSIQDHMTKIRFIYFGDY